MGFRRRKVYGVMAEFAGQDTLVHAIEEARAQGYTRLDAYTPYPIEDVSEALGHHRSRLPLIVLIGGALGCLGGFSLAYWCSVIAYPMNIGGKALNSWPAFIVPTFECTILLASLSAVVGMLALNGLPAPYHPVFNVERFNGASRDRYFLCIMARDPKFDLTRTREFLAALHPTSLNEVDD